MFFSYDTPVAAEVWGDTGHALLRTDKRYSVTTSKHINKWLDGRTATEVPQQELERIVNTQGQCLR